MNRQTISFKYLIYLILIYSYVVLTNVKINRVLNVNESIRTIILLIFCCYGIIYLINVMLSAKILILEGVLIIHTIYMLINLYVGPQTLSSDILYIIYLPLTYLASRFVFKKYLQHERTLEVVIFIVQICFFISYFLNRIINADLTVANTIYYQVCLLPQNIRAKSKIIRISSFMMVTFCVFFSAKRVAFLAWICCFIMIVMISCKFYKQKKQKKIIYIVISTIGLIFTIFIINSFILSKYGVSILDRMMKIRSDGGSGRNVILYTVIESLKKNNIKETLVGHGMCSTATIENSIGAHNDFIEIYYREGIIGLILTLVVYSSGVRVIKKLKNIDMNLYYSFVTEAIIFILLMLFSQITYIASYNCFFTFELAYYVTTVVDRSKKYERIQKTF